MNNTKRQDLLRALRHPIQIGGDYADDLRTIRDQIREDMEFDDDD